MRYFKARFDGTEENILLVEGCGCEIINPKTKDVEMIASAREQEILDEIYANPAECIKDGWITETDSNWKELV
jgi:hypothetical protein